MKQNDVSFYGYNDGKAITIHNCLALFLPTMISITIATIMTIFGIIFKNYFLLFAWGLPLLFGTIYLINIAFTKYNDDVFLKGAKKKHSFILKDGVLFKDGKEIKSANKIRLFKFKRFIFLELKNSYYRIPNEELVGISRKEFLSQIKRVKILKK